MVITLYPNLPLIIAMPGMVNWHDRLALGESRLGT
jgi:hypothetical protein